MVISSHRNRASPLRPAAVVFGLMGLIFIIWRSVSGIETRAQIDLRAENRPIRSCEDSLTRERLTDEQVQASFAICLSEIDARQGADLADLLREIVLSPYRHVDAQELSTRMDGQPERVRLMMNAIRAGRFRDPQLDISQSDFEVYIAKARELDEPGILAYLLYKAAHHNYMTDRDPAMIAAYTDEALRLATAEGLTYLQGFILSGKGQMALDAGDYGEALRRYEDLAEVREIDPSRMATTWPYMKIGQLFHSLGDYESAVEYFARSRSVMDNVKFPTRRYHDVELRYSTGLSYQALGDVERAAQIYRDALAVSEHYGEVSGFDQQLHDGLAACLYELGDLEGAIRHAEAGLEFAQGQVGDWRAARTLSWLGSVHLESGNLEAANAAMERATDIMEAKPDTLDPNTSNTVLREALYAYAGRMADTMTAQGRETDALRYSTLALKTGQAMIAARNSNAIANSRALMSLRDNRQALDAMRDRGRLDESRMKVLSLQNRIYLMLFIISLLGALLALRFYIGQKRLAQIRAVYVRDTHHRAKNHLQILTSLLSRAHYTANLKAETLTDHGNAVFRDIGDQARAMALLHDQLQDVDPELGMSLRADTYLRPILDTLAKTHGADHAINTDGIAALDMDIKTVTPLSLIVTELVSNSLKHGTDVKVDVDLKRAELDEKPTYATLSVRDNGTGFNTNVLTRATSTGLSLVKDLVAQVDGRSDVVSDRTGTTWNVTFPLQTAR